MRLRGALEQKHQDDAGGYDRLHLDASALLLVTDFGGGVFRAVLRGLGSASLPPSLPVRQGRARRTHPGQEYSVGLNGERCMVNDAVRPAWPVRRWPKRGRANTQSQRPPLLPCYLTERAATSQAPPQKARRSAALDDARRGAATSATKVAAPLRIRQRFRRSCC